MRLHPFQVEVKKSLYKLFADRERRGLVIMPTGSGKTITTGSILRDFVRKFQWRIGFFVTFDVLVEQSIDKFSKFGINAQPLKAGYPDPELDAEVVIISIQTLERRMHRLSDYGDFNLLFFDECHTSMFRKSVPGILDHWRSARVVGLTATPWQLNKRRSLRQFFDDKHVILGPLPY